MLLVGEAKEADKNIPDLLNHIHCMSQDPVSGISLQQELVRRIVRHNLPDVLVEA